jgi:hypothetical protein
MINLSKKTFPELIFDDVSDYNLENTKNKTDFGCDIMISRIQTYLKKDKE